MKPEGAGQDRAPGIGEHRERVEELVAAYLLMEEEGRAPLLDSYLAQHPRYAEELARLLSEGTPLRGGLTPGAITGAGGAGGLQPGSLIDHYELLELVAVGGGGTVYRARDTREGHLVALKVFHMPRDRETAEAFRREADLLRRTDLVGVIGVYELGESGSHGYLATKWIEGRTLGELAAEVESPGHHLHDHRERARLVARLARALQALHGYGILHRDIKPSNILVDRTGEPVLIDFGIARLAAAEAEEDGGPSGTPRYMPPEVLEGGSWTPRSEVYALGLCLYELVTGTRAFMQEDAGSLHRQISKGSLLPPDKVDPAVPPSLAAIVLRACAREPGRRHGSMEALAADLERFAVGRAPEAATLAWSRPLQRVLIRHRRLVAPAAAALAVALLVGGVVLGAGILEQARLARHREVLAPWVWAPREVLPGDLEPLMDSARVLAAGTEDSVERLQCAWFPYTQGRYTKAASFLGSASGDEPPAMVLFRDHLDMLIEELRPQGPEMMEMQILPGLLPGPGSYPEVVEVEDVEPVQLQDRETEDGLPATSLAVSERRRRWLLAPPPAERVTAMLAEADTSTPLAALLEAHLRWRAMPADLEPEEAAPWVAAIRRAGTRAVAGGLSWGRFPRAAATLRYGEAPAARKDLEVMLTLRGDCPAVVYMAALARAACGAPGCGRLLSRAVELFTREGSVPGQVFGWWAVVERREGRPGRVRAALEAWREARGGMSWQERVLPLVIEARLEADAGRMDRARGLLERAIEERPFYALPLRVMARMSRDAGSKEEARRLFHRAMGCKQQWPATVGDWLRGDYWGLRPYSRKTVFTTRYDQAADTQPR